MRLLALSDVHVDHAANRDWLGEFARRARSDDVLILAGDVTDDLERLTETLSLLVSRFALVAFVPGNHELWVRDPSVHPDSLVKLYDILATCRRLGVATAPRRLGGRYPVWVVPLQSWYVMPDEGDDGLYLPKDGEDPRLRMWRDRMFVRWPLEERIADFMAALNEEHLLAPFDAPAVTFSHFLPRRELMLGHWPAVPASAVHTRDPYPRFNFSRVAGFEGIDRQLRSVGAEIHVYGHQHRNRCRAVDGVLYVSHCLGYPRERREGRSEVGDGARLLWDTDSGRVIEADAGAAAAAGSQR